MGTKILMLSWQLKLKSSLIAEDCGYTTRYQFVNHQRFGHSVLFYQAALDNAVNLINGNT